MTGERDVVESTEANKSLIGDDDTTFPEFLNETQYRTTFELLLRCTIREIFPD